MNDPDLTDPAVLARVDQVAAGTRETDAAMRHLASLHGTATGGRLVENTATPAWVTDLMDRHDDVFATGRGRACQHWPGAPLRFMSAWQVGLIVCDRCLPALVPTDPVEEGRCDRCAQLHPGRLRPFGFRIVHPSLGAVMIWTALCHACLNDTELELQP